MTSRDETYEARLDLRIERVLDVRPELVWAAWTNPAYIKKWFTPAPWTTIECEIDLRPGGIFRTVMRSPEGQDYPHVGCYLEIIENEKLVWTDALGPGFRPSTVPFFTATIALAPEGAGTRYTAIALHKEADDRKKHEEMGFHDGWSKALDQLVALVKKM